MESYVNNRGARIAYLARQPIYDAKLGVYGYELLYRGGRKGEAGEVGVSESAATLVNALLEFGLDRLVGDAPAFFNVPTELLSPESLAMLPRDRVVVEILETADPTPCLLASIQALKSDGYIVALDDYVGQEHLAPLLPLVNIVKVDVLRLGVQELQHTVRTLRGMSKTILAEKVETKQAFDICKHLGFDLFQGYFFARPVLVEERATSCNRAALLALLAKLQDPDVSIQTLEAIIEADITLSYRLLRFLRSAAAACERRVGSVRQAVLLLGLRKTSAIAAVLALSGFTEVPADLLSASLLRARMCEEVATQLRFHNTDRFFTVGLLSFLDVLLSMPMQRIVAQLPLEEDVVEALVCPDSDNELRNVLRYVEAIEAGDWESAEACDIPVASPAETYIKSLRWADEVKIAA